MDLVLNVVAPVAGKLVERTAREWMAGLREVALVSAGIAARARRWALSESEILADLVAQGRAEYELSRRDARTTPPGPDQPGVSAARRQNAA